jgi:hypothetical protein
VHEQNDSTERNHLPAASTPEGVAAWPVSKPRSDEFPRRPLASQRSPRNLSRYRSFVTSTCTRASSHTQDIAKREESECTSSPRWVRAATNSNLPWGFGPFDAYRSEQRPTLGFQTQLCSAFRFSQPLDALLRSQPLRPCFIPVTPLGCALSEVSPPW